MKQLYLIFIVVFLSISMVGCDEDFFTTTITLDPPEHTPRLVVHAFNSSDNILLAQITRTSAVSELEISGIDRYLYDATASLYKENSLLGELQLTSSPSNPSFVNYSINLNEPFQEEVDYTLIVSHPDYTEVRSVVRMPKSSNILDTDYIFEGGIDETGSARSAIDVELDDEPIATNYYEASITRGGSGTTYVSSLDPSVNRSLNHDDVIISDASFDGEKKIIRLQVGKSNEVVSRFLIWRDISEEHYIYSKTLRSAFDLGDNPFTSPVQIKGNIEGGFGLFTLMNIQTIEID